MLHYSTTRSSLNRRHTPSPPANSGHHAHTLHNSAEEVDRQEEYQKLRVKYNALKGKNRIPGALKPERWVLM